MDRSLDNLISPLIEEIIKLQPEDWASLKYEINQGPVTYDFPYYYKALAFQVSSKVAVLKFSKEHREEMLQVWKGMPKDEDTCRTDDEIISHYGLIVWEEIIRRAEIAASTGMETD